MFEDTETEPQQHARLKRRAANVSVTVALILILAKLGAYLATDSVSLLSSLIDSSTDFLASIVILVGVRHAQRPADLSHRFGHGKAESLAALAQSAFVAGSALFLTYEAIRRLIVPEPIQEQWIGVLVMVLAIVLTGMLVLFQRHVIRKTGSVAIGADSLHYRGDLLMNLAVIAALMLAQFTGWPYFDPLFAFGIAAFLMSGAWGIARGSLDVLMDRELSQEERKRIEQIVGDHPETRGMHDLRTRSTGTHLFIELHLELDGDLTVSDAHDITDEVERRLVDAFPNAEVIVHQEPAGLEDERLDARIANGGRSPS